MRVTAQETQGLLPSGFAYYTLFIPSNEARRWATYILSKLQVAKTYVGRNKGTQLTGDPKYIARYIVALDKTLYDALMVYMPYAPTGVRLETYNPQGA
jgi:hypothetical protein